MRCAYLAQDRADISEATKCLARGMSKLRTGHMKQLKRVASYLTGVPRKARQHPAQEKSKAHLEAHVDSNWARDTVTRRSTTGVIVRRGQHLLKHSSTVQNVIGLSSAESEYNALNCSSRCIQTLRVQKQLLLEEELARALVDKDAMAARTCSSKTLTSCESSIRTKSCRHVDESPWKIKKMRNSVLSFGQTELCAETLDKESKGVKKTKEVKFAVEAIEMDETVKNKFKDARIARAKNESKVEQLRWIHMD